LPAQGVLATLSYSLEKDLLKSFSQELDGFRTKWNYLNKQMFRHRYI